MSKRYDEARSAYEAECERVKGLAGITCGTEPYDLTGAYVVEHDFWRLLKNPTKTEAARIYESLLAYGQSAGWDVGTRSRFLPPETDHE